MLSKPQFDAGGSSGKSKHPRCDIQIFQTMEEVTNQIYDIFVEIQPLVLHEETFTSRCCEQAESAKTVFESLWSKWRRAMPPCQDELHLCCMPGLWCFQLEKSLLHVITFFLAPCSAVFLCTAYRHTFQEKSSRFLQIARGTLASHNWLASDLSKDDCAVKVPDGGSLLAIG